VLLLCGAALQWHVSKRNSELWDLQRPNSRLPHHWNRLPVICTSQGMLHDCLFIWTDLQLSCSSSDCSLRMIWYSSVDHISSSYALCFPLWHLCIFFPRFTKIHVFVEYCKSLLTHKKFVLSEFDAIGFPFTWKTWKILGKLLKFYVRSEIFGMTSQFTLVTA